MIIEINGYEFKLLRNCKKARELLENYKNKTVKEEFPDDVLDTSSYCSNGYWLNNHQFVLDYHRRLEEMRAELKAKRTRVLAYDDHAYCMGFTVEYEGQKYLAVADGWGSHYFYGDNYLIKIA